MRCNKCSGNLEANAQRCPRCGSPVNTQSVGGTLKTSTILISADNTEGVYRSVDEVPEPLRKKLLRSTNSLNSRTMLIADRRGRQEIAKVLKKLPGASQRRLSDALADQPANPASLSKVGLPQTIALLLIGIAGVAVWLILSYSR